MKSKKPFFSRELIYNNIRRFWWIAVLYTLGLFLVSPLVTLTNGSDIIPQRGYNITFGDIFSGTIIFLLTVPVFIAVMVFRYMQNSKSMVTMHAMPYTRLRLYVNNIISGLILLIVPILLNSAFLSIIQLGNLGGTYFKAGIVLRYLGMSLMTSITLYIWAVFAGMFTGSSIAQIIFTYILNFLFVGIISVSQFLLRGILYGFVVNEDICLKFLEISPIAQIFLINDSGFSNEFSSWQYLLVVNIVISIIMLITGYFVYKYRNLENAGDVISGKYVKPIFKYGVSVCVMLVGVVYVNELFDMSANIFVYLIFALIGYIIAEMLLRKSFKIWDSYKGFLCFSVVAIIVFAGVKADLFGYEKYVPNIDVIECVALNNSGIFDKSTRENPGYGVLYEEANIENVIKLHEKIIEDKNINLSEMYYSHGTSISYKLKDGRIINRYYEYDVGKYDEFINKIFDSREYKYSTNDIFDYTVDDVYGIRISNAVLGRDNVYVTINNREEIEEFFEIMKNDILNTTTKENEEYRDMYRVDISVESKNTSIDEIIYPETIIVETKDSFYESTEKGLELLIETFNLNAENVIKFIEDKGYNDVLKNTNNINMISLIEGDIKSISNKDKISSIMDIIYSTPTVRYYRYGDTVELQVELLSGNARSIDILEEYTYDIKKIFE